jgi:hypothetical protein
MVQGESWKGEFLEDEANMDDESFQENLEIRCRSHSKQ